MNAVEPEQTLSSNLATQQKLQKLFNTPTVEIIDNSWQHAGHAAMKGISASSGTHLSVTVVSEQFEGLTTLNRHRMVQKALKEEFGQQLHALQIKTFSPQEWNEQQPH